MSRKFQKKEDSGKSILLVDDDKLYVQVMSRILHNEGHRVEIAENGKAALEKLSDRCFDLLLIDYYMPGMTGEELIGKIRATDKITQIILQTGYANEQPPRELIKRMDIQGFYNKSEGPENFLLWVDVGLKAAASIQQLTMNRKSLRAILAGAAGIFKIQAMESLLSQILDQIARLVSLGWAGCPDTGSGAENGSLPKCLIATMETDSELVIQIANNGAVDKAELRNEYSADIFPVIKKALQDNLIHDYKSSCIIPLSCGEQNIGVIIVARNSRELKNEELISVFANQAAVAIQNIHLYQQATFDPLTKIFMRGVFVSSVIREMRLALRNRKPLCLLLADLDGMKKINDTLGHLAGDQSLRYISEALGIACRETDIRGRLGGDEFALLLLEPGKDDIIPVGKRILEYLAGKKVEKNGKSMPIRSSIGICYLEPPGPESEKFTRENRNRYFMYMYKKILQEADDALYEIKGKGGNEVNENIRIIRWQDPESISAEPGGADADEER